MEIVKTDDFEKSFEKLSKEIQRLYKTQEKRFEINWHDPRLHIKKVRTLYWQGTSVTLLDVGYEKK